MTVQEQERSTEHAIVKPDMIRRSMQSETKSTINMMRGQDVTLVQLLFSIVMLLFYPLAALAVVPLSLSHYLWATGPRYRLPYRMPIDWGGTDFSLPRPDGKGFRKAEAILFLGNHYDTGEQLWITNSDARRHAFVLGTTGSGKALRRDALALTPHGWKLMGELRAGDVLMHPLGGTTTVESVHPQGKAKTTRLTLSDGREISSSHDHLWQVQLFDKANGLSKPKKMTTADIAMFKLGNGDAAAIFIPRVEPLNYKREPRRLNTDAAQAASQNGLDYLDYRIDTLGTARQRRDFFRTFVKTRKFDVRKRAASVMAFTPEEAALIKDLIWSIGGTATTIETKSPVGLTWRVHFNVPGFRELFPGKTEPAGLSPAGVEVISADEDDEEAECVCIKTSRKDGLFITDGYVVTHNTEMLLGLASQALMWSSGFIFVDGKGTPAFASRIWSLCKRFGREDDYLVVNFTDSGGDPDAPAGGPEVQSNTMNPFAKGTADQLMNLVVSLMGDAGAANDMWKSRAVSLISGAMRALVEMRNAGDILLDVQTIRDFLPLGQGVMKKSPKPANSVKDLTEEQWRDIRARGGMIELYLRAQIGEFSNATYLALKGFFDTLPGYSNEKAIRGEPQEGKASEQYGFLAMQMTKPLGSMADDFGHIFRTPLGEVDMEDVAYNRRVLVVLLPALQKAPDEMRNCGKIIVAMIRQMMGYASGSRLAGSKRNIIDAMPTKAMSPFIIILDEIGYYMVEGVDVMLAQGRSLGFSIIPAGQDMAAMGKTNKQVAESVAANARLTAFGAMEDGNGTLEFMTKKVGQHQVAVSSGYTVKSGLMNSRLVDRQDVSFQQSTRVTFEQVQSLREGEFYFVFEGILVKSRTFYIGEDFTTDFSVNKFLRIRGPRDKVPGLDQSVEIKFIGDLEALAPQLGNLAAMQRAAGEIMAEIADDDLENDHFHMVAMASNDNAKAANDNRRYPQATVKTVLERASRFNRRLVANGETAYVEDVLDDNDGFLHGTEDDAEFAPPGHIDRLPGTGRRPPMGVAPEDDDLHPDLHGGSAAVADVMHRTGSPERTVTAGRILERNQMPTETADMTNPDQQVARISGLFGTMVRQLSELETLITSDIQRGAAFEKSVVDQISTLAKPAELPETNPDEYLDRLGELSRYLSEGG